MRGLRTKLPELSTSLSTHAVRYDIVILVETWLTENFYSAELGLSGYNIYRCDRSRLTSTAERGGGILVAVSSSIVSSSIAPIRNNIEQLLVRVSGREGSHIIGAMYLPPVSPPVTY